MSTAFQSVGSFFNSSGSSSFAGSSSGSSVKVGASKNSWISNVAEGVTMAAGAYSGFMNAKTESMMDLAAIDLESGMDAMNARLAESQAELYNLTGDVIETQHLINRNQIREKYIRSAANARAKFGASGVDVGSGSPTIVVADILEQLDKELDVDRINESVRTFNEVVLPKTQAKTTAVLYNLQGELKQSQKPLVEAKERASKIKTLVDFGTQLTQRYA